MSDTDIDYNKALFERIDRKKNILDSKRPLPTDAVDRLQEEFRLLHTYHSNAIEGNTLTLSETKIVIEEGITIGGKPLSDHLWATGNAAAFDKISELSKFKKKINQSTILDIHEIVTKGLIMDYGKYRTSNVRITGSKKSPPNYLKVPKLMDQLMEKTIRKKTHPVIKVTFFHHKFVEIHPFTDGNGRVARLLSNLILIQNNFPPIILRKEDRKKYYKYLRSADAGNLTPFVNFNAKAVDESLTLFLSIFGGKNELLTLKELAKSSPYTQEYLSLRARQGVLDSVKLGNVWHSTKRALDEYLKAHKK
jgi:Fic family protein